MFHQSLQPLKYKTFEKVLKNLKIKHFSQNHKISMRALMINQNFLCGLKIDPMTFKTHGLSMNKFLTMPTFYGKALGPCPTKPLCQSGLCTFGTGLLPEIHQPKGEGYHLFLTFIWGCSCLAVVYCMPLAIDVYNTYRAENALELDTSSFLSCYKKIKRNVFQKVPTIIIHDR